MASLLGRGGRRHRRLPHPRRASRRRAPASRSSPRACSRAAPPARPRLPGVGLVILDEIHERNLPTDLALALTLDARRPPAPRPAAAGDVGDARRRPVAAAARRRRRRRWSSSEGRTFPVEVRWAPPRTGSGSSDARRVARARRPARRRPATCWCSCPGIGEIRRVAQLLAGGRARTSTSARSAGALSLADQDRALAPVAARAPAGRAGHRHRRVEPHGGRRPRRRRRRSGPRAPARPAHGDDPADHRVHDRASAEQRAGRAGRTEPGVAYRLWSKVEHAAPRRPPRAGDHPGRPGRAGARARRAGRAARPLAGRSSTGPPRPRRGGELLGSSAPSTPRPADRGRRAHAGAPAAPAAGPHGRRAARTADRWHASLGCAPRRARRAPWSARRAARRHRAAGAARCRRAVVAPCRPRRGANGPPPRWPGRPPCRPPARRRTSTPTGRRRCSVSPTRTGWPGPARSRPVPTAHRARCVHRPRRPARRRALRRRRRRRRGGRARRGSASPRRITRRRRARHRSATTSTERRRGVGPRARRPGRPGPSAGSAASRLDEQVRRPQPAGDDRRAGRPVAGDRLDVLGWSQARPGPPDALRFLRRTCSAIPWPDWTTTPCSPTSTCGWRRTSRAPRADGPASGSMSAPCGLGSPPLAGGRRRRPPGPGRIARSPEVVGRDRLLRRPPGPRSGSRTSTASPSTRRSTTGGCRSSSTSSRPPIARSRSPPTSPASGPARWAEVRKEMAGRYPKHTWPATPR